jgi:hypothetical protein
MPSSFVGCQSMGAIRSLNLDEWPSFHLRKIVQRINKPPTEAATTMRTVEIVVLALAAAEVGAAELVASAAPTKVWDVLVTVDFSSATAEGFEGGVGAAVGVAAVVAVVEVVEIDVAETETAEAELADALPDAL